MSNVKQIEISARFLMDKYELQDWKFKWHNRTTAAGTCCYSEQTIYLSKCWCEINKMEDVRDTILHEIAHALTKGDGHGPKWKAMCQHLMCRPSSTTHKSTQSVRTWVDHYKDEELDLHAGDKVTVRINRVWVEGEFVGYKKRNRQYPFLVLIDGTKRYKLAKYSFQKDKHFKSAAQTTTKINTQPTTTKKPKINAVKTTTTQPKAKKLSQAVYINMALEKGLTDVSIINEMAEIFEKDAKWAKVRFNFHMKWLSKNKPEYFQKIQDIRAK